MEFCLVVTGRVLDMPTEELGAPAYRKYDIEAYLPFKVPLCVGIYRRIFNVSINEMQLINTLRRLLS